MRAFSDPASRSWAGGNTLATGPFVLDAFNLKLAFICDRFGNSIELADVLP